jgi:hypothetical protein
MPLLVDQRNINVLLNLPLNSYTISKPSNLLACIPYTSLSNDIIFEPPHPNFARLAYKDDVSIDEITVYLTDDNGELIDKIQVAYLNILIQDR